MNIEIEGHSGFCFGVINAIRTAEKELKNNNSLYCLGDIVHNGAEVNRLEQLGLKIVNKDEFYKLRDCKVLIRAHGEPPETYQYAKENNIELLDATCPVVLRLQKKVQKTYQENEGDEKQIVIFGKPGHAEVIGLSGQTNYNSLIIKDKSEIDKIDFNKPIYLYSQTTKNIEDFQEIVELIEEKKNEKTLFVVNDSICRQVSNRVPKLKRFATAFDIILFVSSKKSSNGRYLYDICKETNKNTYFISSVNEIEKNWFNNINSVGIAGATSTPMWLMKKVADYVDEKFD